jgi:hypothetical protein
VPQNDRPVPATSDIRQSLLIEADPDLAVADLGRIDPRRLLPEEACAGIEVEFPVVVGAGQRGAQELALDERVALVRAGVAEGVRLAVDDKERDLVAVLLHDRASVGVQSR